MTYQKCTDTCFYKLVSFQHLIYEINEFYSQQLAPMDEQHGHEMKWKFNNHNMQQT